MPRHITFGSAIQSSGFRHYKEALAIRVLDGTDPMETMRNDTFEALKDIGIDIHEEDIIPKDTSLIKTLGEVISRYKNQSLLLPFSLCKVGEKTTDGLDVYAGLQERFKGNQLFENAPVFMPTPPSLAVTMRLKLGRMIREEKLTKAQAEHFFDFNPEDLKNEKRSDLMGKMRAYYSSC